ncbi:MAG: RNA 2',3'-cyclic phosphodiesterase [Candidatus Margulisbacteria bacterium]|nr:RNA 2',3'-cyclic phosphodiesterase [Candidatus Margulisiibacteriota bacterium]
MRLFISVELPDEIKKSIAGMIARLKETGAAVKWVEEENLHLTLKFIGEVAERQLAELISGVEEKIGGSGKFQIKLENLGTFPEGEQPRVVWVGVSDGGERLKDLARLLAEREFVSHVTIGRIKDNKGVDKLIERVRSFGSSEFGGAPVDRVSIMKSTLTSKGPVYEKIKEVKL